MGASRGGVELHGSAGRGKGVGWAEAFVPLPAGYRPRDASRSVLHRVVREHLSTFLARAGAEGGLPKHLVATFHDFLRCGDPSCGFARLKCEACGHELFVPFSCKRRGLCPSCGGRWMADVAAHLVDSVIPRVPTRQWVLSVPFRYRCRLARDPRRMRQVQALLLRAVFAFYRRRARALGIDRPQFGAVVFPQRFGSSINVQVHWHCLFADGVFISEPEGAPSFRFVGEPSDADVEQVAEVLAVRVGRLASRLGWEADEDEPDDLLGRATAASLQAPLALGALPVAAPEPPRTPRCAQVDGYSVHANVALAAWDRRGLEKLLRYMARPPLAVDRLSLDEQGRVIYRLRRRRKDGADTLVLDPVDLVARLAALLPPPKMHGLTYCGIFGPAAKDRAAIVPSPQERPPDCPRPSPPESAEPTPRPEAGERRARKRLSWASLLERCFAVDVTRCGKCGGAMRLIALIEDRAVAKKILDPLGLRSTAPPLASARPEPQAAFDGFDPPFWVDDPPPAEVQI